MKGFSRGENDDSDGAGAGLAIVAGKYAQDHHSYHDDDGRVGRCCLH